MRRHVNRMRLLTLAMLLLVAAGPLALDGAGAQEGSATPTAATPVATVPDSGGWPVSIHSGTCDAMDPDPAFTLTDVTAYDTDPPSAIVGSPDAEPVSMSQSKVDVPLDDLLASPFAINVLSNDPDLEVYVACGDIGGVSIDNQMLIGLRPLNDSGLSGVVQLVADGESVSVTILLTDTGIRAETAGEEENAEAEVTPEAEETTEEVACDTATEDCNGDGVVDDLEGPACDPYSQDCDGDGFIDIATCDPYSQDCDGDGFIDLSGCDPYYSDCDGDGFIDIESCDSTAEDCDGDGIIGHRPGLTLRSSRG